MKLSHCINIKQEILEISNALCALPSLVNFSKSPILQVRIREERHMLRQVRIMGEKDDNIRVFLIQFHQPPDRLSRRGKITVVLLTHEAVSRSKAKTVVTGIACKKDEAVRRDTSGGGKMSRKVTRRVDEVKGAIAVEIHGAFVWPKGRDFSVAFGVSEVDEFGFHIRWEL
jgi:hypothetical protein